MDLVVGDENCGYLEICRILLQSKSSEPLFEKLVELARALELSVEVIHKLKLNEKLNLESRFEALHEVLVNWRSEKSDKARLSVVITQLANVKLMDCADDLRDHFKAKQCRDAFYACPPDGYNEFLASKSRVLVISSVDKQVTAKKLTDATSCIHLEDHKEFARQLVTLQIEHCISFACNDEFSLLDAIRLIVFVPKGRVILITEDTLEKIKLNISMRSEQENLTTTQDTLKWSNLSPIALVSISEYEILVSGKLMTFKEVANKVNMRGMLDEPSDEQFLLDLVNDRKPSLVESGIPTPIAYYVPRRISPRSILNPDVIFKNVTDDIFVFTGIERHKLSRFANPHSTDTSASQRNMSNPTVKFMFLEMKSDFANIAKRVKTSLHWIDFKEDKFYWRKSSGKLDTIQKAIDVRGAQTEHSEVDLLKSVQESVHSNLPVILSDTPGMGKSQLLANFARELKAKGEIVLFVVLYDFVKGIKSRMGSTVEVGVAVVQQLSSLGGSLALAGEFLKEELKSGDIPIHLLLDGLDEVMTFDLKLTFEILKTISSMSKARLWVATRPHLLEDLENCLCSLGHTIQEFNAGDQLKCLVSFWKETQTCEQRLVKFAGTCLSKLVESDASDIAGVPLQCRLIGEIFKEDARNYADPDNLTLDVAPTIQIESITHLFQLMIEKKLEKYFERYKRVSNAAATKFYSKELIHAHMAFSLQLLFPHLTVLKKASKLQFKDIRDAGILESVSINGIPHFIHRMFAEFFVALFLQKVLCGELHVKVIVDQDEFFSCAFQSDRWDHFVGTNQALYIQTYKFKLNVVLYFLDNLIQPSEYNFSLKMNRKQLVHSCASGNYPKLFECFEKMSLLPNHDTTGLFDSTLIIVSARYSGVGLIARICEKYENVSGFRVRDIIIHSQTVLHLVVKYRAYSVVEYFINRQGFRDVLQILPNTIYDFVHKCVQDSANDSDKLIGEKIHTLNLLLEFNGNCLKDGGGRNPLVRRNVHHKLLCHFIRRGARVTAVDNSNMTFLNLYLNSGATAGFHELCSCIPTESIAKLLEMKTSEYGDTPLQRYVRLRVPDLRMLLAFSNFGADFNAVDLFNNTVVETAVANYQSIATIDQLVLHGAKWQRNDTKGWTILHTAMTSKNFPAFKYFGLKLRIDESRRQILHNTLCWDDFKLDLKDFGVNLNAKNGRGDTVLTHLNNNGVLDSDVLNIISLLERNGAITSPTLAFGSLVEIMNVAHFSNAKETDTLFQRILAKWPTALNESDDSGYSLLHYAARTRNETHLEYLISMRDDADAKDKHGETPLQIVLSAKSAETLSMQGTQVTSRVENMTPLHLAVKRKDTLNVERILACSRTSKIPLPIVEYTMYAAKHGDFATFQICHGHLDNDTGVVIVEPINFTILLASIRNKDSRIFEHLAEKHSFGEMFSGPNASKIVPTILTSKSDLAGKIRMLEAVKSKNQALLDAADSDGRIPLLLQNVHVDLRIWLMENVAEPKAVDINGRNLLYHVSTQLNDTGELLKFLTYLVKSGKDELIKTDGSTLLLEYTRKGKSVTPEILELLRDCGVDFNITDNDGITALMHAVKSDDYTYSVTKFVEMGADWTMVNRQGSGILHLASEYGNVPAVKMFVNRCDVNSRNINLDTPLHLVLKAQPSKITEIAFVLVSEGADINASNHDGMCPLDSSNNVGLLHCAAMMRDIDALQLFMEKGWEVNGRNVYGATPIHFVALGKLNTRVIKIVFDNTEQLKAHTTLLKLTSQRNIYLYNDESLLTTIEMLATRGANLCSKDNNGRNIVHLAAYQHTSRRFQEVLDWVIAKSAEELIGERDSDHCTPLHIAASSHALGSSTLDILLKYSDINDIDIHGNNVLFRAVEANQTSDIFQMLIAKGATWNTTNIFGETLLHVASRWGCAEPLKFFIETKCDTNARNNLGETPLHYAFRGEPVHHRIIVELIKHNADESALDNQGRTPEALASEMSQCRGLNKRRDGPAC